MGEDSKRNQTSQAVEQQIKKNKVAIEKLKHELEFLDQKIRDGEKKLERSRQLISRYDELSERILKLNKKMKAGASVPPNVKQHFDELLKKAESIENELSKIGVNSLDDYNKLVKTTKDNRQMFTRYNEMLANIEKQNEYYENLALRDIPKEADDSEKKDFKALLVVLKKEFNTQVANFEQLNNEISDTERKIKNLLVKQSIANEIYDTLRVVEAHMTRYENAKRKIEKMNEEMIDSNGRLKDPSQREFYLKQKDMLDKQMKSDYEIMYSNSVGNINDFDEKDTYNKKEIKDIEDNIDLLNRKLRLLKEIEIEFKKIVGRA